MWPESTEGTETHYKQVSTHDLCHTARQGTRCNARLDFGNTAVCEPFCSGKCAVFTGVLDFLDSISTRLASVIVNNERMAECNGAKEIGPGKGTHDTYVLFWGCLRQSFFFWRGGIWAPETKGFRENAWR